MRFLRITMLAPLYAVGLIVLALCGRYSLPDAEGYFFPVITEVQNVGVVRAPDRVCWTFAFHKEREGDTQLMAWTLLADGKKFFVTPINAFTGQPLNTMNTAPKGEDRVAPLCILLPDNAQGAKRLQINGQLTYRVWHGLWPVEADIPVFPPD